MNILKFIIGLVATKINNCADYYRSLTSMKSLNSIGEGSSLSGSVIVAHPENISLGRNSYINGGMVLASPNARIRIGDNCLISYDVHFRTDMHGYKDRNKLIRLQGVSESDIIVEDDVWIGFGAQIMSGVKIGKGCIIGAGAIVTHDTEPYGVYVGVPAKKIRERILE